MEKVPIYNPAPIEDIIELTKDANLPKLYSNGFQCGMTLADATIVFKNNNVNVAMVSMTIPAMKSLFLKIGELMANYQNILGQQILSFDELVLLAQQQQATEKDGK